MATLPPVTAHWAVRPYSDGLAPRLNGSMTDVASHRRIVVDLLDAEPTFDYLVQNGVVQRCEIDEIAAIGEDRGTIEDIYEPFLIQEGYLDRTPRGRIATLRAYQHFGVTPARDVRQEKLL